MKDWASVNIRNLQHFIYCPHRWGLMEIEKTWAENYFVVKANIMHERVHERGRYHLRGKKTLTALPVFNDELGIYGVLDGLEISEDDKYTIVEYKPTQKYDEIRADDKMQIFAQKLCVDSIFHTNSDTVFYFGNSKKRVKVDLESEKEVLSAKLHEMLYLMRKYKTEGFVPKIPKGQKCKGCSFKDLCLPKLKKIKSVREEIRSLLEDF